MKTGHYDIVVIGAGSAGLTAAVGAAKIGKSVLLVEREHMGGECTNSGCIPSKALLHHAKKFYEAQAVMGGSPEGEAFRTAAFAYVQKKVQDILATETPAEFEKIGITVVLGEATFVDSHTIAVAQTTYTFTKAIIATGSAPRLIDVPGLSPERALTNQNFFNQTTIPERTVILGAGPIGMELGQALALLGSQVTIATIDSDIASAEDPVLRPIIKQQFVELGITILTKTTLTRVTNDTAIFTSTTTANDTSTHPVTFDALLLAIGRVPNLPSGLAAAGIVATDHGITVDNQYRTTQKHIYAIGDVAQRLKFTHTADAVARHVITRIASKGLIPVTDTKAVPKVTYTQPPMAQVGLSQSEAEEHYGSDAIMRIEVSYHHNDRAHTDSHTDGLLVVLVRRLSGKILGAHIIGHAADEILTPFILAIDNNVSLWKLRRTIYPYPTYSLLIKKAGDIFFAQQLQTLTKDVGITLARIAPKSIVAIIWLAGVYALYQWQHTAGLDARDAAFTLFDMITATAWGPLLYIMFYTIRPVTFFPATLLTILAGVFFGALWGTIMTLIGALGAATTTYTVGRFFSSNRTMPRGQLSNWIARLRVHTFDATLTMRLLFLPYDIVGYVAGMARVPFTPFITATLLGIVLGTASFVSLGASLNIETIRTDGVGVHAIDTQFIVLSVVIFLVSISISKIIRRRKRAMIT